MRALVLALVLLAPAYAGCVGFGPDGLDAATGAGAVPPPLPEGVALEGAEIAAQDATSVTFAWRGEARGPNVRVEDPVNAGILAQPHAVLTLPAGVPFELQANLSWSDPSADLDVRLRDHRGDLRCESAQGEGVRGQAETEDGCAIRRAGPFHVERAWVVQVVNWHSRGPTPFALTLTIRTTTPGAPDPAPAGEGVLDYPRCEHPWPCADGSEWPPGLAGGFALDRIEAVRVPSHDGVELEGWIFHPAVPEGTKVPVVLVATPYTGVCHLAFNGLGPLGCTGLPSDDWVPEDRTYAGLVEDGYAVAVFSTRGTGNSGGCFEQHGLNEQKDYALLVDWLGTRPWSNGRVGMTGLSYPGTTPWDAAIHAPAHLKTIVPAGIITDWYTFYASPQGAKLTPRSGVREYQYELGNGATRPVAGTLSGGGPGEPSAYAERACPHLVTLGLHESDWLLTGDRHEAFHDERRLIDHFADVTASVLVVHGLQDNSGHRYQEDEVWPTLTRAPKRMILGQWGHQWPGADQLAGGPFPGDWEETRREWLAFWLKGLGETPPRVGLVDYQDDSRAWHATSAWPPADARQEVLHLADGRLAPAEASSSARFRPLGTPEVAALRCAAELGEQAVFLGEPVPAPVLVAGNPFLHLILESDRPHGSLLVDLHAVEDDGNCVGGGPLLAWGAVDLQYHAGNFRAADFPVGTPTPVRVDLYNVAHLLQPGHRLLVQLHAEEGQNHGAGRATFTLHPGSHLVLPLVEGTLGGAAPSMAYPPRPFVPTPAGSPAGS